MYYLITSAANELNIKSFEDQHDVTGAVLAQSVAGYREAFLEDIVARDRPHGKLFCIVEGEELSLSDFAPEWFNDIKLEVQAAIASRDTEISKLKQELKQLRSGVDLGNPFAKWVVENFFIVAEGDLRTGGTYVGKCRFCERATGHDVNCLYLQAKKVLGPQ